MLKKQLMYLKVFLVSLVSIALFTVCFGKDNLFIAFAAVITVATMFGEDYTINPIRNTLYFIGVELFVGLSAYLASLNIILGVIITLIVSFVIYFGFSYDTKPAKAIGFIELYLFLLYQPIQSSQLFIRVIALIFGGIVIMILYYILARYNFETIFNKSIKGCIDLLSYNINLILKDGETNKENRKKVGTMIKDLEIRVHERLELDRDKVYSVYLKNLIVIYLKRLNYTVLELKLKESNKHIIERTNELLDSIKKYIVSNDLNELNKALNAYLHDLENLDLSLNIDSYYYYNIKLNTKELLKEIEVDEDDVKKYIINRINLIKSAKFNKESLRKSLKMTSLRFNLAIKGAITLSFSVFIVNYFKIYDGQWALYTISLLLLPYAEQSTKKAKDRVVGTIVGAVLFNIVFYFIQSNIILVIAFIVVCMYLSIAIIQYKIRCIFITLNALLMAGLMDPMHTPYYVLSEYRVFFIVVASILVAFVMNFIFPYKIKEQTNKSIEKYIDINKKIVSDLINSEENKKENFYLLTFISNYMWKKINFNNKELKSKFIQELLLMQNDFIVDLDFFMKDEILKRNKELFKNKFHKFKSCVSSEKLKELAIEELNKAKDEEHKLIIILTYKLFNELVEMNRISNLVCSN
ncbi:FUSC family protein [Clostridium sp.]|uniref:FUSC family protein n=1 Tax=Clostridium sp. TaxID=1506 RepID=UPI0026308F3F|nr:FUSC family protein [Clostridium sp.]